MPKKTCCWTLLSAAIIGAQHMQLCLVKYRPDSGKAVSSTVKLTVSQENQSSCCNVNPAALMHRGNRYIWSKSGDADDIAGEGGGVRERKRYA